MVLRSSSCRPWVWPTARSTTSGVACAMRTTTSSGTNWAFVTAACWPAFGGGWFDGACVGGVCGLRCAGPNVLPPAPASATGAIGCRCGGLEQAKTLPPRSCRPSPGPQPHWPLRTRPAMQTTWTVGGSFPTPPGNPPGSEVGLPSVFLGPLFLGPLFLGPLFLGPLFLGPSLFPPVGLSSLVCVGRLSP